VRDGPSRDEVIGLDVGTAGQLLLAADPEAAAVDLIKALERGAAMSEQTLEQSITVEMNGVKTEIPAGLTLGGLIDSKGIERRMIAVEYNAEILPRHAYDATVLADGDRLEIVQMVGGG